MSELAAEWNALHARIEDAHPSTTHAWISAWKEYLEQGARPLRSTLWLYVIRAEDDSLVAVIPAVRHEISLLGVTLTRWLDIGVVSPYVEPTPMLVAPEHEREVIGVLAREIDSSAYEAVFWMGLRHAAMADVLARDGACEETGCFRLVVPLPDSWSAMESKLSRNMRKTLKHDYGAVTALGRGLEFKVWETPQDVGPALDALFALNLRRPEGFRLNPQYRQFVTPRASAFLRALIGRLAPVGMVRIFQLSVGGQIVAMRIGIVYRGGIYLYFFADDAAWKKFGVLTTTTAEIFKYSIAQRYRFVYLSTARTRSNVRWRPEETPIGRVAIWSRTPRARLLSAARTSRRELIFLFRDAASNARAMSKRWRSRASDGTRSDSHPS